VFHYIPALLPPTLIALQFYLSWTPSQALAYRHPLRIPPVTPCISLEPPLDRFSRPNDGVPANSPFCIDSSKIVITFPYQLYYPPINHTILERSDSIHCLITTAALLPPLSRRGYWQALSAFFTSACSVCILLFLNTTAITSASPSCRNFVTFDSSTTAAYTTSLLIICYRKFFCASFDVCWVKRRKS
jgi:hypothetical protein